MKKLMILSVTLLLFWCGAAMADSINPETYTATLSAGESVTITKTVTITEEVTSAKVDVFFLTDTTGSMGSLISSVKTSASAILSATSTLGDVAYGVGAYRDNGDTYVYNLAQDITTNTTDVQSAINTYSASGGGDWEEANLYALQQVATTTSWREDSTKIVVWFGDAPGHDPSNGVTLADAISALVGEDVIVLAMNTNQLDYYGQATDIATATGGDYYSSINTAAIVSTITDAIEAVYNEYNTVSLEVEGADNVDVTVSTPYTGDYDRSEERTFTFDVTFTGVAEGTDNITVNAVLDGRIIVASEYDTINVGGDDPAATPEPATMVLFGIGLLSMAGLSRRKK